MPDLVSLELLKSIVDTQKDFIIVFRDGEPILTNSSFNTFFGVSSFEQYKSDFGPFVENFVPHPSYFHKEKVENGDTWFESIEKLDETDRIVSMMSSTHEPHAFAVTIITREDSYIVATFSDITQTLIKRIMIENNVSIDRRSGAYDKKYFIHIAQSYEDAAVFNEKIVAFIDMKIDESVELEETLLKEIVQKIKYEIRKDDMLVRWGKNRFVLAFLVEDAEKAKQVEIKIASMKHDGLKYDVSSSIQNDGESIESMIRRIR